MSLTKLIVNRVMKAPKIGAYTRYLFVGPHPDDIEIGAGATAAALIKAGKEVCFLICTDGRFGTDNCRELTGDDLAEKRKEEAIASAAMLGVKDVRFGELSDGGFYTQGELLEVIAGVIGDFQPDIVFAPDPNVTSEGHPDHLNVGNAVRTLTVFSANPGIMETYGAKEADIKAAAFYMTGKPNRFVKTTGLLDLQLKAIFDCHLSQYPEGCSAADSLKLYLKLRAHEYGLRYPGTAEGFRVIAVGGMHCLPETAY